MLYFQDLSLNVHSCLDLHGSSSSFDKHWWYQRYHELLSQKSASFIWRIKTCMNLNGTRVTCWRTGKTLKGSKKWQKNTCGRAAFLEMLQAAITFQRFPCIRKLILQENFRRHIQKYVFFVWCNKIETVNGRHS